MSRSVVGACAVSLFLVLACLLAPWPPRPTAWGAPPDSILRGRRTSIECPVATTEPVADGQGDCACPSERPYCYQDGKSTCLRNSGTRDLHYFAASCETCECRAEGGEAVPQPTCGGESVLPDKYGVCACPDTEPYCIMKVDMLEVLGCEMPAGQAVETRRFAAGCEGCMCRGVCPQVAQRPFADSFGDCACPAQAPVCYENGVEGCSTGSGGLSSNSYFRASCGAGDCEPASCTCECRAFAGNCEPASCTSTASCGFAACIDCDMCLGVSRCPESGVRALVPDRDGNCECEVGLNCFEEGASSAGCPVAPAGESGSKFRASCTACECRDAPDSNTLACPYFAQDSVPDRFGDCSCPNDTPECYTNGERWCRTADNSMELHYFSALCRECTCEPAEVGVLDIARGVPCPSFAKNPLSDRYGNCECPNEKPLCIRGEWDSDSGLPRPYCDTMLGWQTSNLFRYDCSDCSCGEVEGEGDRQRAFRPDEVMNHSGNQYLKNYVVLDLRLINTLDSVENWSQVEWDVYGSTSGTEVFANSVVGGLSHLDLSVSAVNEKLSVLETRVYTDEDLETVYVWRIEYSFGIMWTTAVARVRAGLRALQGELEGWEEDVPASALVGGGMRLKEIPELTGRERNLLLNFPSIFSEDLFKSEFDDQVNDFLNDTWSSRRVALEEAEQLEYVGGNATELAELLAGNATELPWYGEVLGGPLGILLAAPRTKILRVSINQAVEDPLEWTGPLELNEPELRLVPKENVTIIEEEGIPWLLVGPIAGGSCICCCLCIGVAFCGREWYREKQAERVRRTSVDLDSEDHSSSTGKRTPSPGSGSPRRSGDQSPGGAPSPGTPSPFSPMSPGMTTGGRSRGRSPPGSVASSIRRAQVASRGGGGVIDGSPGHSPGSPGRSPGGSPGASPRDGSKSAKSAKSKGSKGWGFRGGKGKLFGKKGSEPEFDLAKIAKMGDLAGHKSLSKQAQVALQADFDAKNKKRGWRGGWAGKKDSADTGRSAGATTGRSKASGSSGGSPDGSPSSGSPRSPREGSPGGGESPMSGSPGASPRKASGQRALDSGASPRARFAEDLDSPGRGDPAASKATQMSRFRMFGAGKK